MTGYAVTDHPDVRGRLSTFRRLCSTCEQFFVSRGLHGYLVGGAVRDALLGRKTEDLDAAVETTGPRLLELAQDLGRCP